MKNMMFKYIAFISSLFFTVGCDSKPFKCNCKASEVYKNDSIIDNCDKNERKNTFLKIYDAPSIEIFDVETYRIFSAK